METTTDILMLKNVQSTLPTKSVASQGQTLMVFGADGTPVAKIPASNAQPSDVGALATTLTLEQSSNPAIDLINRGAAERYQGEMGGYLFFKSNSKWYAAKLNGGTWSKFADGTPVTTAIENACETFVRTPQCNFKASNKTLHFGGLSPLDGGKSFGQAPWHGAYELSLDGNNVAHSRPNVSPAHSKTMTEFWNRAQALDSKMGLAGYQFQCMMEALFQARYGNLNSQEVIGEGGQTSAWDSWRNVAMGLTKELGDGSGKVLYNDATVGNQYEVKLFGFEGLWGKLWEFRPGIRFYMDDGVRKAVVYDGNIVSNTAEGRVIENILQSAGGEYQTQKTLGEYWDALPKAVGGGSTTYYCDGYWASTGGELLIVGGSANYGALCGLSFSISNDGFGNASDGVGARLAFYGQPEIVSGAELAAMIA